MKIRKFNLFITSDINSIGKSLSFTNVFIYFICLIFIVIIFFALFGFYFIFFDKKSNVIIDDQDIKIQSVADSIYFYQDPVKNISGFDSPVISNSFKKGHRGLDITGPIGTKIYSILPGKVIFEGNDKKMGNIIIICHENGLVSKYMHNKKNYLKVGDLVKLDKPIAEMGKTGSVLSKKEGIHLHFELWKNGLSINPFDYIKYLNTIDSEIKINN
tara:strand:- start:4010 stop:4654 length:645 start_codon:yes stop_codon:yes gene_type:complete